LVLTEMPIGDLAYTKGRNGLGGFGIAFALQQPVLKSF
jgi:hypothetical protein